MNAAKLINEVKDLNIASHSEVVKAEAKLKALRDRAGKINEAIGENEKETAALEERAAKEMLSSGAADLKGYSTLRNRKTELEAEAKIVASVLPQAAEQLKEAKEAARTEIYRKQWQAMGHALRDFGEALKPAIDKLPLLQSAMELGCLSGADFTMRHEISSLEKIAQTLALGQEDAERRAKS